MNTLDDGILLQGAALAAVLEACGGLHDTRTPRRTGERPAECRRTAHPFVLAERNDDGSASFTVRMREAGSGIVTITANTPNASVSRFPGSPHSGNIRAFNAERAGELARAKLACTGDIRSGNGNAPGAVTPTGFTLRIQATPRGDAEHMMLTDATSGATTTGVGGPPTSGGGLKPNFSPAAPILKIEAHARHSAASESGDARIDALSAAAAISLEGHLSGLSRPLLEMTRLEEIGNRRQIRIAAASRPMAGSITLGYSNLIESNGPNPSQRWVVPAVTAAAFCRAAGASQPDGESGLECGPGILRTTNNGVQIEAAWPIHTKGVETIPDVDKIDIGAMTPGIAIRANRLRRATREAAHAARSRGYGSENSDGVESVPLHVDPESGTVTSLGANVTVTDRFISIESNARQSGRSSACLMSHLLEKALYLATVSDNTHVLLRIPEERLKGPVIIEGPWLRVLIMEVQR